MEWDTDSQLEEPSLEKIALETSRKEKLAWLEINLEHLRENIMTIRKMVGNDRKVMAVVKADAYGLGGKEISQFLLSNGVDELAVSNVDEGVSLRLDGIQSPILILGTLFPEHAEQVVKYNLTATVCHIRFAKALNEIGKKEGKKIRIHVRVDLGLGTIGLLPNECIPFFRQLQQFPWLEVEGIFAQLASSYDGIREEVLKDIYMFESILDELKKEGWDCPVVHLASSAALLTLPEAYYDMVRPGIVIYGMPAIKGYDHSAFKPIMELKARVVAIKEVEENSLIGGYGDRYIINKKKVLATVSIGYGDGLFLFFLKGGEVIIHGKRVSIIGKPFMDHLIVDVTDLPEVSLGDEVVIFGSQQEERISVEEIAEKANIGMMNCDCVTLLSERVPRIYKPPKLVAHNSLGECDNDSIKN